MPAKGYFLCTSPRSGSTLTCDLLTATGVAGHPNSFFRPQSIADFCDWWHVPRTDIDNFDQSYIDTAIANGTAGTDTFGMRIMWSNMPVLLNALHDRFPDRGTGKTLLNNTFGPLKFVHLSRQDKVAEAVSLAIAAQTGLWHVNADGSERERITPHREPTYDAAQIAAELNTLNDETHGWRTWFAAQNIRPLTITYESLSAEPQKTIATILTFLDLDPAAADTILPATLKLATPRNQDWITRFRAENPDLP